MSGNKEFLETVKEANDTTNELANQNNDDYQQQESLQIDEIKYQSNEPNIENHSVSLEEYTQNQDSPVTPPTDDFSPMSDSSSINEEPTYKTSTLPQNSPHETTQGQRYNGYFEQNINQINNLNERAYYANFYQYIPQAAIGQNALSNNNGNQNDTLNNGGGYVMALPANATARIDPSLLNYENNMTMQVATNYVQPFATSLPTVRRNPVSNNQVLYWNEEPRPLPSYYGSISGGTTVLGYEDLAQHQMINGNRVTNASLVTDSTLKGYMALADAHSNKGKKKRGRKPESDYPNMFSSLPSPTSTDEIRQSEIAQCSNCGVRDTPAWRRDLQGIALLCNACGLYLKNKGVHRPTELAPDGTVRLMRTQRPEPEFACHNCGTRNSPCWRGLEGQKLCNKCGLFLKQHGYARPPNQPPITYNSRKSSSPTFSPY